MDFSHKLNFSMGPVMINEEILLIGAEQVPYFRNQEFSNIMLENEQLMKELAFAEEGSRAVFITGSGTAVMEASIMNLFSKSDLVLIINGGCFGQRFCEICDIHEIPYKQIYLSYGDTLTAEMLSQYDPCDFSGLLVNLHETTTGVLYPLDILHAFCNKNPQMYFVVDAVSAFIADEINMSKSGIDVLLTSSQKALAIPPGVGIVIMNKRSTDHFYSNTIKRKSLYLDIREALINGERGQTPFTPAVSIMLQLNKRLRQLSYDGIETEREKIKKLASDFRNRIQNYPFKITWENLSNSMTPITSYNGVSGNTLYNILKDEYDIYICPNGGDLKDKQVRIGHIGNLTIKDNDTLFKAFDSLLTRGLL